MRPDIGNPEDRFSGDATHMNKVLYVCMLKMLVLHLFFRNSVMLYRYRLPDAICTLNDPRMTTWFLSSIYRYITPRRSAVQPPGPRGMKVGTKRARSMYTPITMGTTMRITTISLIPVKSGTTDTRLIP